MSTQAGKTIKTFLKNWISLVGILLLIVVFSILSQMRFGAQYFLTLTNWKTILLQTSTVAIVALGQSIMLMTGNFDLSLGPHALPRQLRRRRADAQPRLADDSRRSS